ncbi:MAG TPA: UvrD-helicase domain-containing protein [Vicinamibacterales bacterium]|nr:UvrD-helicase domain-containing protein [Vicinamibacterales bacterium]
MSDAVSLRQRSLFDLPALPDAAAGSAEHVGTVRAASDDDEDARAYAVSPEHNVVLEASAGTGKTSVLVARYVNLLRAGVDPSNILAITFTRKAAAEMRERILRELRHAAARSELDAARWTQLRDRLDDVAISTIDAFCLSLLREFPLEADLDPGFGLADETEVPRLIDETLDQALRLFIRLARDEQDIALVLAQLGLARTRAGLASLLDRRLVAWQAIDRFLARGPLNLDAETICRRALSSLADALRSVPGAIQAVLTDGPAAHPRYRWLLTELRRVDPPLIAEFEAGDSARAVRGARIRIAAPDGAAVRGLLERVSLHFLTADGKPRTGGVIPPYNAAHYRSPDAARRHRAVVFQLAPAISRMVLAFDRDLNLVLARGVRRMLGITLALYRRALEERSVVDFSEVQQRALDLFKQMDEFAQSRFRLESRYHHVLVDEFQDTSRAQWELVSVLVRSWGEGLGMAANPSIFIVGDRKQSIYRFRDADVTVLEQAAAFIEGLRPGSRPRRAIRRSFRALPTLLELVNDLFGEIGRDARRPDDFSYGDNDRFPVEVHASDFRGPVLGIGAAADQAACARVVTGEIGRLLREGSVRDRTSGVPRDVRPGDIAILFRSRTSHREVQLELERAGIPAYVYKGLGFFDADETRDVVALIRFLARPDSDLRAAAFLRSRFVRLSDPGLARLGSHTSAALLDTEAPAATVQLGQEDRRVLVQARHGVARWLPLVDRVPPADLLDGILAETAYACELRGPRRMQAWENLKKARWIIRRVQNRGYATLVRIADHLDALTAGDDSTAVLQAVDAVNLMTVHASKGLEFPVVFIVNVSRGASGPPRPVRVVAGGLDESSVSIGPFVSDADEADRERERHETRRLLYVAMTRARDRLYLSGVLKDGQLVPGRGSLAEVLPASFNQLFGCAAAALPACESVTWTSSAGRVFEWRICRAAEPVPAWDSRSGPVRTAPDHLSPLSPEPEARPVTTWLRGDADFPIDRARALAGLLVHRLFQAHGADAPAGLNVVDLAAAQLRPAEREQVVSAEEAVASAARMWDEMRGRDDVRETLRSGECIYELPFTLREQGQTLRGRIDCLVRGPDRLLVVEFKTGRGDELDRRQAALYVRAVEAMWPGVRAESRIFYAAR